MVTLDVGCGNRPKGDYNVDFIDQKVPNFYKASAYNLPFPDKMFDKVFCFHTIEHLEDPCRAIREMKRVGKELEIRVPYRMFAWNQGLKPSPYPRHQCSFDFKWFEQAFKNDIIVHLDLAPTFRYNTMLMEIVCVVHFWEDQKTQLEAPRNG